MNNLDNIEGIGLIKIHHHKLLFKGDVGDFYVIGGVGADFTKLQVTLKVHLRSGQVIAGRFDLYDVASRTQLCSLMHVHGTDPALSEGDCMLLLLMLDQYRDENIHSEKSTKQKRIEQEISHQRQQEILRFLHSPNLMRNLDKKIRDSGIIGETHSRLTVFIVASSYKQPNPLHLIVQGTSGSGKTHLISSIADCIGTDDVIKLTRVTNASLYYLEDNDLTHKLVVFQDADGLAPEALFALRELQSSKTISNYRPSKDRESGNIRTISKQVKSSFASLMATTRGDIYYDNLTRSIMISVDESHEQTHAIIRYQSRKRSGSIDRDVELESKKFLRDLNTMLKGYEVINPYAERFTLPVSGLLLRRLNEQFIAFVEQITILHQYQRKTDKDGRLIVHLKDIEMAIDLFFEPLFIKVDDLAPQLRHFFELLKKYVKEKHPDGKFRQRDIRLGLEYSKAHVARLIWELKQKEYIRIAGGSFNRGYVYEIDFWDDLEQLKLQIKTKLQEKLKDASH